MAKIDLSNSEGQGKPQNLQFSSHRVNNMPFHKKTQFLYFVYAMVFVLQSGAKINGTWGQIQDDDDEE